MISRRFQDRETSPTIQTDRQADADPSRLDDALAALESAALAVYVRFALPDRPGQYSRAPGAMAWAYLAERLSPQEKWALLETQPLSEGWRYADLSMLGADSPVAQVRAASKVLTGCTALRQRIQETGRFDAGDMADAVRLGVLWGWIAPSPDDKAAQAPQA